ncbi:hypothetical protein ES288_D01G087700v1 [Gossypium darwinii]|uniref:Transmembrane protein n=1 Tax=Gossypium darwinii TaxID=34276 RepID=A0A5D2DN09_GOSDA|nr:hypothetical protein ES288_D01G087700v1 [Gossypium darwinii]
MLNRPPFSHFFFHFGLLLDGLTGLGCSWSGSVAAVGSARLVKLSSVIRSGWVRWHGSSWTRLFFFYLFSFFFFFFFLFLFFLSNPSLFSTHLPSFTTVRASIRHHQNTPLHHLSSNGQLVFQESDPNLMKQRPKLRSFSFSNLPFTPLDHHRSPYVVHHAVVHFTPIGIVEQRSRVSNPNSNR